MHFAHHLRGNLEDASFYRRDQSTERKAALHRTLAPILPKERSRRMPKTRNQVTRTSRLRPTCTDRILAALGTRTASLLRWSYKSYKSMSPRFSPVLTRSHESTQTTIALTESCPTDATLTCSVGAGPQRMKVQQSRSGTSRQCSARCSHYGRDRASGTDALVSLRIHRRRRLESPSGRLTATVLLLADMTIVR
jgi:hypothetical protein